MNRDTVRLTNGISLPDGVATDWILPAASIDETHSNVLVALNPLLLGFARLRNRQHAESTPASAPPMSDQSRESVHNPIEPPFLQSKIACAMRAQVSAG